MVNTKIKKVNILTLLSLIFIFISNCSAAEILNIDQDSAKTINLKNSISTVFLVNPTIADYKIIDDNKLVIFGVGVGSTSVIVYGKGGSEIYNTELIVNKSLRLLKQTILARFPGETISVSNIGDQVVLDGVVSSERVKKAVSRLVGEMLKKQRNVQKYSDASGGNTQLEYNYHEIINNMKVLSTEQINVKITVAEVASSFLNEIGVSYSEMGGEAGKFVNKITHFSAKDIVAVISAVGNESVGHVLAEPNLSVISGEKASFLVGGEIPIGVRDDKGVSISYKEYGVKLSMIAKVADSENIRLSLFPEVSTIDENHVTKVGQLTAPSLQTRRAETTVQLKDGQSFVLAGLLRSEERESLSKVPYLGDIPIIGALFSHSKTDRSKTELIIVATVNLVTPVDPDKVKLPGFHRTSDIERLLNIDLSELTEPKLGDMIIQGGFN
ncbi:type II and III secretion system protein family protein [Vibrio caribbeanicus]|uniref:Flp pilus assembly protein n=1 Tax=Vibrio caribbeanicus ATCC BAA-2122 TaxID=796620 RepID=E3BK65_9VIBR|nr:Flp pilus assembly protein [Vibrio caribbeanicus ATCC BAA-2122]